MLIELPTRLPASHEEELSNYRSIWLQSPSPGEAESPHPSHSSRRHARREHIHDRIRLERSFRCSSFSSLGSSYFSSSCLF